MAAESNASIDAGSACQVVSSNGAARVGTGQGSMRSTKFQGTAGYVTCMSGGVGGGGRETFSYPDWASHAAESIHVRVTDPSANGAEHGQSHRTPARS